MVDFQSKAFQELSVKEKRDIVLQEFQKCQDSFEYYIKNYAYIKHPNAGILKMEPFDFQLDVAIPISYTLLHRRSQQTINMLENYRYKFDYEKWLNRVAEENIEMMKYIPATFHEHYRVAVKSPDYNKRIDTIILKSRQTGLSTIFQQLIVWHVNFHPAVGDLVISKKDRDAKKFLKDVKVEWGLIPNELRARRLAKNEHELWVSITGQTEHQSGVEALPPTEDAGRSFSPNLVILDEFAEYRKPEQIWTAISMSVSAGGVIVIIATPKGVGNLYHQIWTATNKSLSTTVPDKIENVKRGDISVFRPVVVHWSQLPAEEFKRRGFDSALDWYFHMRGKLAVEGGEKMVAQELDLDFNASGDTISHNIIKKLEENKLELKTEPKIIEDPMIKGLIIYEEPQPGFEYLIGVDTSEGVGQDSHSFHVLAIPNDTLALPRVVAAFNSNKISIKRYKDLVAATGKLYNEAWLNIERNNHGHVLLTYFIEEGDYNPDKILNTYSTTNNSFVKTSKGWTTNAPTRNLLIQKLFDFITDNVDVVSLPSMTVEEFKTFVQTPKGKWEAQPGYHDDNILSLGLAVIGYHLLPKYKQWLIENSETGGLSATEFDLGMIMSSQALPVEEVETEKPDEAKFIPKHEVDKHRLQSLLARQSEQKETNDTKYQYNYKYVSSEYEYDDDEDISTF